MKISKPTKLDEVTIHAYFTKFVKFVRKRLRENNEGQKLNLLKMFQVSFKVH